MRLFGIGAEGELKKHSAVIEAYVSEIIAQKEKQQQQQQEQTSDDDDQGDDDLLSLFIKYARKNNNADMLRIRYLRDVVLNFMVAGRDTTACTLTNMYRMMSENPEQEARFLQMADSILPNNDSTPSYNIVKDVEFLHAFVNETLRLFPPVSTDVKYTRRDDRLPNGIFVPAGCIVAYATIAMGRVESRYKNAEMFVPDRWMGPNAVKLTDYEWPVFNAGLRLCLGVLFVVDC